MPTPHFQQLARDDGAEEVPEAPQQENGAEGIRIRVRSAGQLLPHTTLTYNITVLFGNAGVGRLTGTLGPSAPMTSPICTNAAKYMRDVSHLRLRVGNSGFTGFAQKALQGERDETGRRASRTALATSFPGVQPTGPKSFLGAVSPPPVSPASAMATRNLTMHFIRARAAAQNSRPTRFDNYGDSTTGLTSAAGAGYDVRAIPGATHVPSYVNDVDEINLAIETIQTKCALACFSCCMPLFCPPAGGCEV